ncbi:sulfotransferase family protein [Kibdelosporangium lantanae]
MLEVIGAGFGRTGTNSLQLALERLGFGPCYHMLEVIRRQDSYERWDHALAADPVSWDRVLTGFKSTVDWPGCAFWRQLVDAFPTAKVVLTVRDPHDWYASAKRTIFASDEDGDGPNLPELDESTMRLMGLMMERLLPTMLSDGRGGRLDEMTEQDAVEAFARHNDEVQKAVPADRLLVYTVDQGWGPLCDFLGVPVPDEPFPHVNDSATFRRTFENAIAERLGVALPHA